MFSVSHTTRKPRPGEQDGVHYNYVTRPEFESLIGQGGFIEYARFGDNLYGTSYEAVERVTREGKICVLDIEMGQADAGVAFEGSVFVCCAAKL